jgi:hypothetical protein
MDELICDRQVRGSSPSARLFLPAMSPFARTLSTAAVQSLRHGHKWPLSGEVGTGLIRLGLAVQGHSAVFEILGGTQVTDVGFTGFRLRSVSWWRGPSCHSQRIVRDRAVRQPPGGFAGRRQGGEA